jgi:LysM repeat protein
MGVNPRAAQELDLLLQEGLSEDPLLIEGLVRLYANELFRFAWVIFSPETESPTVQRLLARRTAIQAITAALHQLRRFQEQPGTFLWLLSLTFQQFSYQHSTPTPDLTLLAGYLQTAHNLPPEDIAYILKIPARRAAALVESESTPPTRLVSHSVEPNYAGNRTPTPLTVEEIAALIKQIRASQTDWPSVGFLPRFFREFAFIGLAVLVFVLLARAAPNSVINLPTPIPSPTLPATIEPNWEATPPALPTTTDQFPTNIFYEPENPYLVWRQTQILQADTATINALAFSPTEPILAAGNNIGSIILWDTTTFIELETLEAHSGGLRSLAFSPDGALMASGGGDGTVRIWEMPSGFLVQVLEGHPLIINSLSFSPDGETLAVAAGEELWFWQMNSGVKIASYDHFDQILYSVRYSPDGNYLGISEADGIGWILRARDGYPLLSFQNQNFGLINKRMMFSPDGKYLLSISRDNHPMIIQLIGNPDQLEGEIVKTLFQTGENSYVPTIRDFNYSPNGNFVAAATDDGSIFLWDATTWTALQAPLRNYDIGSQYRHLDISFDSQMIAISRLDGEIGIWKLEDVSVQVAALEEPRYFQRLESDIRRWTFTYPDETPDFLWEENLMNLEEASAAAGFTVKIPFIELLGGDHQFNGVAYDPVSQIVVTNVWANNQPGALWGFTLLQRKVEPGQLMAAEDLYLGTDVIGMSAIVEPVQIGDAYGETVIGDWVFLDEENPAFWDESPQPGDKINFVNRWSEDSGNVSLRWKEGDILYEIKAYIDWYTSDPLATRDALILLANSLFAPDQVNFPWNATPYTYTIQSGDTCTSLAEQFVTTIETITNLNGLSDECELIAGQTLLLPYPAEAFATTDLNCDSQNETILLLQDGSDPNLITGTALDVVSEANIIHRVWEHTAAEMGTTTIQEVEVFLLGECVQLIALSGGTSTAGRTRVFRWDGISVSPVLDASGWPNSYNGLISSLEQGLDSPFLISIIEYAPNIHPVSGLCPNEVTDYTWNGVRFEKGQTQLVLGACINLP